MAKHIRPRPLSSRPTVSVVIPCYNYGNFLPEAVSSALDQPGVAVDVLIVDDASTDGSLDVSRSLERSDPRISVLAHKTNKGHIATYNDGIQNARGDYVVLLSADDLVTPGSFTRATALMESHPEVVMTYGYAPTFTHTPPAASPEIRSWTIWTGNDWIRRLCKRGSNVVMNPEAMLRTAVVHEIGGYDAIFPQGADLYMWLRAAQYGSVGRINGAYQAFYREHGANMHLNDFAGLMNDLTERRSVFERLLKNHPLAQIDRQRLYDSNRRALALESLRLGCQAFELGGSHGGASVRHFANFALETWPEVVATRTWHSLQLRINEKLPLRRLQYEALYRQSRDAARWRRWRRFGS